jgi:predicted nucleic-acid-binding Zn-ribbon protein
MGIVKWWKNLWAKPQTEYVCPKCGSKDLGYTSVISNFVDVVRGTEDPTYLQSARCFQCGYSEQSTDGTHLKKFEQTVYKK